jgi:hypothetical protein
MSRYRGRDFLDEIIEDGTKRNPDFPKLIRMRKLAPISWRDIADAVSIYETNGFKYIEVPWVVSDASVNVTLPKHIKAARCVMPGIDLPLVGSAEQSFIELAVRGDLPNQGRFLAVSPCFRDDAPDDLHQKTFMKVELIELAEKRLPKTKVR